MRKDLEKSAVCTQWMWILIAVCLIGMVAIYCCYIMTAKSTVPIMDYWHWTAIYGEKIENGTITFSDYFFSDKGQHIQPLPMAIQFSVLSWFDFDVQPLVIGGLILRLLMLCGILFLFWHYYRNTTSTHRVCFACVCILVAASVLNYNQWELTTEPFSLGTSLRVTLYFVSFLWAAAFAANIPKHSLRRNLLCGGTLGLFCVFLTVFVGAAYFVGHLTAIGAVFVGMILKQRKRIRDYISPMLLWFVISLSGAIVYYSLYTQGGRTTEALSVSLTELVVFLCKAELLFWGAAILPETIQSTMGLTPFYICGGILLLYILFLIVRLIKTELKTQNVFPAICILYAFLISLAIAWGRVETFGGAVMLSSRYTVEGSIGLLGVVWLTYEHSLVRNGRITGKKFEADIEQAARIIVSLLLASTLFISAIAEWKIAPYRKLYNDGIKEIMLNIDNYADDELGSTQGSPEDVRYCINFFKKYNLSIFAGSE